MPLVTSGIRRPRWWAALRGFLLLFGSGSLGSLVYDVLKHRPIDGTPWGELSFWAVVFAVVSALFPGRVRR
jgi:hypothetical protein